MADINITFSITAADYCDIDLLNAALSPVFKDEMDYHYDPDEQKIDVTGFDLTFSNLIEILDFVQEVLESFEAEQPVYEIEGVEDLGYGDFLAFMLSFDSETLFFKTKEFLETSLEDPDDEFEYGDEYFSAKWDALERLQNMPWKELSLQERVDLDIQNFESESMAGAVADWLGI